MNKSALVVIPTTGNNTLHDAIESVVNQDTPNVTCLVVIDGPEYADAANRILQKYPSVNVLQLPWNTGRPDFYGHRIYALTPALTNTDYWLALDQDNWIDTNHVRTMVDACETNNWQWCHSYRKVYDKDKNFVCEDNCESLGRQAIYFDSNQHLVDTSTYCIRRETIVNVASAWYSGWGGDRRFYSIISQHVPNFGSTGLHTVNYRLDGNPGSVTADFFIHGNQIMQQRFPSGYPWKK